MAILLHFAVVFMLSTEKKKKKFVELFFVSCEPTNAYRKYINRSRLPAKVAIFRLKQKKSISHTFVRSLFTMVGIADVTCYQYFIGEDTTNDETKQTL